MEATPEMLAALEPGEWLVRVVREGWTAPPDYAAIRRSNLALREFQPKTGAYRGGMPNDSQAACLRGTP